MAAEYTENLGLKKPAQEDFYNVDDFNENADIIDTQITELKKSVSDGKTLVANAITEKGVATETDASFATMATNVKSIVTMEEGTKEATAAASDILSGKIAYGANGVKLTGTIASQAAQTITPGTSNKTIAAGKYLSGVQTIKGDSNLKAANIKKGVSIFGVAGSCDSNSLLKTATKNIVLSNITLSASAQSNTAQATKTSDSVSVTLPENTKSFSCSNCVASGDYRVGVFSDTSYNTITNKNYTISFSGKVWSGEVSNSSALESNDWYDDEDHKYYYNSISVELSAEVDTDTGIITVSAYLKLLVTGTGSYKYTNVKNMTVTIPITYQYYS